MMLPPGGRLQSLVGSLQVKPRVQHPGVKQRKDRPGWPWVVRFWFDEVQSDGSVKVLRKYHEIGPSKGEGAISKKQAEVERDIVLAKLNAATAEIAVEQMLTTGVVTFGEAAKMYQEGYLGRVNQISKPTRVKDQFYLDRYIVPKWGSVRLNQIQPRAVEDWLQTAFGSWSTMHGVRAIMIRVFHHAEGHGLWEEGKAL